LTSTVYYDIIHPAQNEVAEGDPHSELKNFIGRRNTMTIWIWFLAGLIGLLVYINLGHLIHYMCAKADWSYNKNKRFNLAAKIISPSPNALGIFLSRPIDLHLWDNRKVDNCSNFADFYTFYSTGHTRLIFATMWPIALVIGWVPAAIDWIRLLLSVVFYKWLVRGLIYKVFISGHWTERLR